jgi:hypothetical protein
MTLPSASQQAHDDAKVDGLSHPECEMLGRFEPRDAKRILKRLDEEHLSFEVKDCSQIGVFTGWLRRRTWLCIYIHPEHKAKAEAVVFEDVQL